MSHAPDVCLTSKVTSTNVHIGRYRSPLRYPGGKQKAIQQIAQVFPESAREYREPLVGGGSVYFHARTIDFADRYWINDKFQDLVAFGHTVQKRESCARVMTELEHFRVRFKSATEIKKYFVRAREQVAT